MIPRECWICGQIQVPWTEFARLSAACRIDLKKSLQKSLGFKVAAERSDHLIRHLLGGKKVTELSLHLKISRYILSRWLSGKTCPSLKDVLFVIDKMTPVLVELIGQLVPIEEIPALKAQHSLKLLEKELNYKYPYLGAVLRSLELKDYKSLGRHTDGHISRTVGISLAEEQQVLQDLLKMKIIKKEFGLFTPNSNHIDTRGDFQGLMNIRKYWLQRSLHFASQLSAPPEYSKLGYNVMSVSRKASQAIQEKYFQFFQDVRSIVELDQDTPEDVQILNIQLLVLSEMVQRTHRA